MCQFGRTAVVERIISQMTLTPAGGAATGQHVRPSSALGVADPLVRAIFVSVEVSLRGTPRGRENEAGCPPTPVCPWSLEAVIQSGAGARQQGRALLP
jgi:hypothetical protein